MRELDDLRDQLSRLPDEQLIRIATVDAAEYRREAVEIARLELSRRGITDLDRGDPEEAPGTTGAERGVAAGTEEGGERSARCSFCGKRQAEVRKLITGPNASICDACVTQCYEALAEIAAAGDGEDAHESEQAPADAPVTCEFCHREASVDDCVYIAERGPLCSSCLDRIRSATGEEPPG